MDNRPTTTCIINNFNYGDYLSLAVQSCLNQTCPFDEIIIVDDGSSDNSVALIQQHFYTIPTIQLICKTNAGQLSCLDIGFQASNGDIVFFLDSDDTFAEHYVEAAVAFYQQNTSCDFLFCGMQEVGQKNAVRRFELEDANYGVTALLTACLRIWIGAPTSALSAKRTSLSKVFPTDPSFWPDWRTRADDFLIYELSMAGARKYYMDKVLVNYHIHGTNLSKQQNVEEQNGILAAKINRLFEFCTIKYALPNIPVQKVHLEFALHPSPSYTLLRYYLRAVRKSSLSPTQKLSAVFQLVSHFFATQLIGSVR
jgi:glycosyltransferase involved in cell wall biosynthesis